MKKDKRIEIVEMMFNLFDTMQHQILSICNFIQTSNSIKPPQSNISLPEIIIATKPYKQTLPTLNSPPAFLRELFLGIMRPSFSFRLAVVVRVGLSVIIAVLVRCVFRFSIFTIVRALDMVT